MVTDDQRMALVRGIFDSYYKDFPEEVIIDTNRAWTAQLPALMRLFPDAKLICTVRNVAWVMDSLERQFRGNHQFKRTYESYPVFDRGRHHPFGKFLNLPEGA